MSKSAIYTALTSQVDVLDGNIIPVGSTVRRFGAGIYQDGNTIKTCGRGYYAVNAVATIAASSADPVTISLQQDGVDVIGAKSTITVAGTSDETVLPIVGIVRNRCECGSTLSFVISGADVTIDNLSITVEKL